MDVYILTVRVLKSIERVGYLPNILISPDGNNNNNNNISYNIAHCSRTRTGTVGICAHANPVHLYIFITIMQVVFIRRPNDMIMFFFREKQPTRPSVESETRIGVLAVA